MAKKVVLFIVEGPSEAFALKALENLFSTKETRFDIVHGDITADHKTKNPAIAIADRVKIHCCEYKYKKADISEVVLIVDTDGAYISDANILPDIHRRKAYYDVDKIFHCLPKKLIETRKQKRKNLDRLISLPTVWGNIPFRVYYFSCNLDHVICGNPNLANDTEKTNHAISFHKKYSDNLDEFISFFKEVAACVNSSYDDSWNYIKEANNSLQRCSNFNVFLVRSSK